MDNQLVNIVAVIGNPPIDPRIYGDNFTEIPSAACAVSIRENIVHLAQESYLVHRLEIRDN